MSEEQREMLGARVPSELKRLVDADSRPNQEVVEVSIRKEFGGKRESLLDTQIQSKKERIKSIKAEIEELEQELERYESQVAALEERKASVVDESETLTQDLDELLNEMKDHGEHVFPDHGVVKEIAAEYAMPEEEVLTSLKKRAVGRDLSEITQQQFVEGWVAEQENIPPMPITEVEKNE